jgi:RNA polymerase sigma factor (sigma-70 family)
MVEHRSEQVSEDSSIMTPRAIGAFSLQDVVVNRRLLLRPIRKISETREMSGIRAVAGVLRRGSAAVLNELAELAIDLCDAGSGGVSVIEDDGAEKVFRWRATAGKLKPYLGGSTPRNWSPCGECLNAGTPMLYSFPGRYFTYLQKLDVPVVEVLIIPMYAAGLAVGTIWIVSHDEQRGFNAEDVRVMTSMANFAARGLYVSPGPSGNGMELARLSGSEQDIFWSELVRRIALGDHWALTELTGETQPFVFAIALRIVSFRADAEEVTADVYVRAWKTAESYSPQRGSVHAWLIRMARSIAIDRLRSRSTRDRSEVALSIGYNNAVDPGGGVAILETRRYLHEAIQALPFEQRRAIELAYFSGLTASEIAGRLGHPLGSVKSRIRLGLMRLRLLLSAVAPHACGLDLPLDPGIARKAATPVSAAGRPYASSRRLTSR